MRYKRMFERDSQARRPKGWVKKIRSQIGDIQHLTLFAFVDGTLSSKVGKYRYAANGQCQTCMGMNEGRRDRVVDETVVYNCRVEVY